MKRKILYIASIIVIAVPWLFLLEILPVPYSRITAAVEVTIEGVMFAALFSVVILLRKELKRQKTAAAWEKGQGTEGAETSGQAESGQAGSGQAGSRKNGGGRVSRAMGRLLFVLASITMFLIGLILVLIAVSYSV